MPIPRLVPVLAFALVSAPAHALQTDPAATGDTGARNAVAEAMALIEAHRVNPNTGCGLPVPTTYNAPSWQQRAANFRRQAFEECLRRVMAREESRLRGLEERVRSVSEQAPDVDWSGVTTALAAKWDELETVNERLNIKVMWADTMVNIVDTFTGPGAPFDGGRVQAPYNPYANPYGSYNRYGPYNGYRPDSSVVRPGIR